MKHARAYAKINLGLVVGPLRTDGKHEIVTVLQRIDLHDDVTLEPAEQLAVEGFAEDTIVRTALTQLAGAAGVDPLWRVGIEKRIPVAAGLGGGSADAAAALSLANAFLPRPLPDDALHRVAAGIGADVPFFLTGGAQLGTGVGTELAPVALPTDYHVVLLVPHEKTKQSTASVYASFDALDGARGFDARATEFREALSAMETARDLGILPPNDLAFSPFTAALRDAGAFRADVSGAGPAVYGLFERADDARRAADALEGDGVTFVTRPI
jgi:4-diphosphocytidyl-2-C-methyl-D-erythritol kinase